MTISRKSFSAKAKAGDTAVFKNSTAKSVPPLSLQLLALIILNDCHH